MFSQVTIASLLAIALAVPAPLPDEGGVRIPFSRSRVVDRDNKGAVSAEWFFSDLEHTLQKYGVNIDGFGFPEISVLKKRASVYVLAVEKRSQFLAAPRYCS